MIQLNENEIELVSAGGAMSTIGNWIGNAVGEWNAHPEAAYMPPVISIIYLATRH